jgi:hypothetical protein
MLFCILMHIVEGIASNFILMKVFQMQDIGEFTLPKENKWGHMRKPFGSSMDTAAHAISSPWMTSPLA